MAEYNVSQNVMVPSSHDPMGPSKALQRVVPQSHEIFCVCFQKDSKQCCAVTKLDIINRSDHPPDQWLQLDNVSQHCLLQWRKFWGMSRGLFAPLHFLDKRQYLTPELLKMQHFGFISECFLFFEEECHQCPKPPYFKVKTDAAVVSFWNWVPTVFFFCFRVYF